MKLRLLSISLVLIALVANAITPQQTAGIYYAYPEPQTVYTPVPEGYTPFYISHYGRHGSRWVTDDKRYTDVFEMFANTTRLTPLGIDVYHRLEAVLDDALGRSGSLSPVGQRQHHGIGARMYENQPEVFAGDARVHAVSSTAGRCIMSMSYFCEALKEHNPQLQISRTPYEKDMDYIAYTTPEGKRFSADTASWRKEHKRYVESIVNPDRLISSLFTDADGLSEKQKRALAEGLYWIASDMQDVDLDVDLYDIFTMDELEAYWRSINSRMYVCNGDAPLGDGVMIHCADNLLTDILTRADAAVAGGDYAADLRFGHDTHLLRLLALMGIEGATGQSTDMARHHEVWQDYRLSPMAANLQMIFYRNPEGYVIVKLLLNENEITIPALDSTTPYYPWSDLRAHLTSRLSK